MLVKRILLYARSPSACPSGSYADGPNLCLPCPDVHHVTVPPAIGSESCVCKEGYSAKDERHCEGETGKLQKHICAAFHHRYLF